MKRIISVLLENEPGSLSRIVGLFSQRGYNIDSLTVAPLSDSGLSRITITTRGDDKVIEQITKQVNKLVDVLKVSDLTEGKHIERELMLVKVATRSETQRNELQRTADIFRGQIVDMTTRNFTIQLTGDSAKLDAFMETVEQYGDIIEAARTGVCGIARGDKALRV